MSRQIMVGVDGSAGADRALRVAMTEARTSGRPLTVVASWVTPVWLGGAPGVPYPPPVIGQDAATAAARLAQQAVDAARADNVGEGVEITVATPHGPAGRQLVECSQEAGLLVVGSRGHNQLTSAMLGSTSAYVLHHARCPVLVVPDRVQVDGAVQRVVVGLDGSAASRSALRWALDAARRRGCPLVAVHSWLSSNLVVEPSAMAFASVMDYQAAASAWLDDELARELPARPGVPVDARPTHSTPAWGVLQNLTSADLLVVGSRGRGGFTSLMLGSVAAQCSQHAPCPVVVVRAGVERLEDARVHAEVGTAGSSS